jgi:hypothetical protein
VDAVPEADERLHDVVTSAEEAEVVLAEAIKTSLF